MRCASTGLLAEQRSDRWVAVAMGPQGEALEANGDNEIAALNALARELTRIRGTMSGR